MKTNNITLDDLDPNLASVCRRIEADNIAGKTATDVYVVVDGSSARPTWLILERSGILITVQYNHLDGLQATYPIRPSREHGSGLHVTMPSGSDIMNEDDLMVALDHAFTPTYRNFTMVTHANHGWSHFAWTRGRLVHLLGPALKTHT